VGNPLNRQANTIGPGVGSSPSPSASSTPSSPNPSASPSPSSQARPTWPRRSNSSPRRRHTSKTIIQQIKDEPESRREWLLENFKKAANEHPKSREYKFWQDGYHPVELYSPGFIKQKLDYIHNNPVEEMLVQYPWEYMFSSARNYADMDSLLDVTKIYLEIKMMTNGSYGI